MNDVSGELSQVTAIDRRGLLKFVGGAGMMLAVPSLLSACGSSPGATSDGKIPTTPMGVPTQLPGGTPVRGGTFTIGTLSGGQSETIFPGLTVQSPDFARCTALYDWLWDSGEKISPIENRLCVNAEPNSDGTVWTLELRDGVTWHDGKPFTADDVVYTFQKILSDSQSNYSAKAASLLVETRNVRKRGKLVVELPTKTPVGDLPARLAGTNSFIVPAGSTVASLISNPVGTGPFRFKTFTPGRRSEMVANRDYWDEGKPYVDELIVDSSFSDDTARMNALIAGEINLAPFLPTVVARQQLTSRQFQVLSAPVAVMTYYLIMRVDDGPMSDPRVRLAMKLLVNRQALIDGALDGLGEVAHDLIGVGADHYASDLKREQDVDKAKALFAEAGVAGKTFEMYAYSGAPGGPESATLFAEQASKAGINVKIIKPSAADFYTPASGFLTRPFAQEFNGGPYPSLAAAYTSLMMPDAPYNETGWGRQKDGGSEAVALIEKALTAVDRKEADSLWRQVQQQQFDEGGNLAWANAYFIDGAANNVRGFRGSAAGNLGAWRMQNGWIAK